MESQFVDPAVIPYPPGTQGAADGQGSLVVRNTFLTYVDAKPELRSSRSESDLSSLQASQLTKSASAASPRPGSSAETGERTQSWSESSFRSVRPDQSSSVAYATTSPELDAGSAAVFTASGARDVNLWSKGNENHASGQCRPCLYVRSSGGCIKGASCKFCHANHSPPPRSRPCRATRARFKQMVEMLESDNGFERAVAQDLTQRFARDYSYMRTVLRAHAKNDSSRSGSISSASSEVGHDHGSQSEYIERGQSSTSSARQGSQNMYGDHGDYQQGYGGYPGASTISNQLEYSGTGNRSRHVDQAGQRSPGAPSPKLSTKLRL